jgi:hypothetical protein
LLQLGLAAFFRADPHTNFCQYYPASQRLLKYFATFSVVLTVCACVIIALVATIICKSVAAPVPCA